MREDGPLAQWMFFVFSCDAPVRETLLWVELTLREEKLMVTFIEIPNICIGFSSMYLLECK